MLDDINHFRQQLMVECSGPFTLQVVGALLDAMEDLRDAHYLSRDRAAHAEARIAAALALLGSPIDHHERAIIRALTGGTE